MGESLVEEVCYCVCDHNYVVKLISLKIVLCNLPQCHRGMNCVKMLCLINKVIMHSTELALSS